MPNKIKKDSPRRESTPKRNKKPITSLDVSKDTVKNIKVIIPLKDLVAALVEARQKIAVLEEQIAPLKEVKETLQAEIMQAFKDRGEFSARFEKATATLAVRKSVVVTDELLVIKQLKELNLNDYISEQLNDMFHDSLAKEIAKGQLKMDGVQVVEKEYISVRTNDKEDARKLSTEPFIPLKKGVV